MTAFDPGQVERFRGLVTRRFGLHVEDARLGTLAELLRRKLESDGRPCAEFLEHLETALGKPALRAIISELTIPETYFFRNIDQFRAFKEQVLPDRLRARVGSRRLRILSAGCASGEEAYTLAILLREAALGPSWDVSILGVDVNFAVLEKAARGRFSSWALRETPPDAQRRWFRQDGADHVLDDAIKGGVRFEERNLIADDPDLWQPGSYDVVFWRNVMMYLTPESAQATVNRMTRALAPGGYLFLGHAETLRGVSNDFHLRHTHGTFYYQRREHPEPRASTTGFADAMPLASAPEPLANVVDASASWVDAIHRASQRIEALTESSRPSTAPRSASEPGRAPPAVAGPAWNLGALLDLLRGERFADALDLVRSLPAESSDDPDVLLLHAVLLTHGGQLGQAEEACNALLQIDELHAGAHYLLALCREGGGDRRSATHHDQVAVYLDPAFAMPRLHLGLLARRGGELESARKDLARALVLLEREDASRILLFGGGFGREALAALCRAELLACGGKP